MGWRYMHDILSSGISSVEPRCNMGVVSSLLLQGLEVYDRTKHVE
jgi:hypothetical protein